VEARATWGRFRRLWLALAALAGAVLALAPMAWLEGAGEPYRAFPLLCALTCWGSAWLGADLLSLGFKQNPDPLRQWRPAEFAARAAGRLLPFNVVVLALVATLIGRSLHEQYSGGPFIWTWGWCAAAVMCSGVPYFAMAACLSATARKPRRWAAAPAAVVMGSLAVCALLWAVDLRLGGSVGVKIPSADQLPLFFTAPSIAVGIDSALLFTPLLPISSPFGSTDTAEYYGVAAVAFVLYAVPPALIAWAIAERRYRRSPEGRPEAQSPPPSAASTRSSAS
jgi:hypothetical protein